MRIPQKLPFQQNRAFAFTIIAVVVSGLPAGGQEKRDEKPLSNFERKNLVAWCIVPFDIKNRGPKERAEMLQRLGLHRVAYDWRENHVPTFEEEIVQYKKHGLEYFAFWGVHEEAFRLFEKHGLHPQVWQTAPSPEASTNAERVKVAAAQLAPLIERTRQLGSSLGLYNHGGWGGEPQNLVAVCKYLRDQYNAPHVGIVYNLHHAHDHVDDFAQSLEEMKPYLLCLNLNGMTRGGDRIGKKILPIGAGELDVTLFQTIAKSGYDGPLGVIGHTQDDVELRLKDNLDGLDWVLPQVQDKPTGPRPTYRTWSPAAPGTSQGKLFDGIILGGKSDYRQPPLTVECRVTLPASDDYNILVASDTKQSGAHWEIFTSPGQGYVTAYLPGMHPDHVYSRTSICDGEPHHIALVYEARRVQLFVDGRQAADQAIEPKDRPATPGDLAIGRLVEGGLGCRGRVEWVHIVRGARIPRSSAQGEVEQDDSTVLLWRQETPVAPRDEKDSKTQSPVYSEQFVSDLVEQARRHGDAHRGLLVFASATSACSSCHKVGRHGGSVGPDLTVIAKERKPHELVEAVVWPKRQIKPEFVAHVVLDAEGRTHQGYIVKHDEKQLVLRDPTQGPDHAIAFARDNIETREVGTLMPDNLVASMTQQQLHDLLQFLMGLGGEGGVALNEIDALLLHANAHSHGPATFSFNRDPLVPEQWPHWRHPVNRDRIYDFYSKQADHFRRLPVTPPLLSEFPGLDGGELGHWGNQNEDVWKSDRWNETLLGTVQCGVFRGGGVTVPRGVCVRLGDNGELSACFNPETLKYDVVWSGGFVKFSSVRHGFMHGLLMDGELQPTPIGHKPTQPFIYRGFYRHGKRVVFAYRIGETELLDSPWVEDGRFTRTVAPVDEHPFRHLLKNAPTQWPQRLETKIHLGVGAPYAVDTVDLPWDNPWRALLFCGGHAFLPDGSALVCTMQGDVWRVEGFKHPSSKAVWRRFAAGLHHALGIVVDQDGVSVLGRDQITRLHDQNGDGEADFYECFSNAFQTSPAGHDFICGLERDAEGRFYTASGNQGLVRVSSDGRYAEVLATGFRNPDGLGLLSDGTVTVPCSEGEWTPASMICAVRPQLKTPHFGYGGPKPGQAPELPLAYLPRGLDNSSGGQTMVPDERWGPLTGQLLHFSFGAGSHFLILRDEVQGQVQGAIVPLAGEFQSGVHRGRFSPDDGQLYVTGMQGWGSYTPKDGCFQRVRFTGDAAQLPIGFHVHQNGVMIEFSEPLDKEVAGDATSHFAQCWNYRYSSGYGSPELSSRHVGVRGHDTLAIASAHVQRDGRTLFLQLPELQPVNQLHLRVQSNSGQFHDLFLTVHRLDSPFTDFSNYQPEAKTIQPHPLLADLAMATRSIPNPHRKKIANARPIVIETGSNLTFQTRFIRVSAGEAIALTLRNPDVVPHNWVLAKPGTLEHVGDLANRLIADPEAVVRHYIPQTSDVLTYTDVVLPRDEFTVYFHAPREPGRYPFLCSFPGHWKVMNGEMLVELADETPAAAQ